MEKDSITQEPNITVNSGVELIYTARNGISLGNGFKVQTGGGFNSIVCPMQ